MGKIENGRMLVERPIGRDGETVRGAGRRAVRSVTVNALESPLGWLFSRGLVSRRQFDAGEQLRSDWERSGLSSRVTMLWDCAPVGRQRGGSAASTDILAAQVDARRRFDTAVAAAGARLVGHIVAGGLLRRGDEGGRAGPRLACARGQAGACAGPRPRRRPLPDPLVCLARLTLLARIRAHLGGALALL